MLVDTHFHFDGNDKNEIKELVDAARKVKVHYMIASGSDLSDNFLNIEKFKDFDNIFFSCGYHPEVCNDVKEDDYKNLELLLNNKKVVAIGEIGLDYHYGKDDRNKQIELFKRQLDLATKYNLPVVIHTRDAFLDTYNILKNYKLKGVIHCFSGSNETAKQYISLGYFLGIGGVVTFKNSKLKDVLKEIGINNIVLETDSPYLSPFRGSKNEPKNIIVIAEFISEYLNIPIEKIEKVTTDNVKQLFNIDIQ